MRFLSSISNKKFPWQNRLEPLAKALLKSEKIKADFKSTAVNIILCTNAEQKELNSKYRRLDHTTDVLSFVWNEPNFLGEIYIAEEQVKKQAPTYGNTYYRELKRVLVHGLLHLCGYDHNVKSEREIMRKRELFYLGKNYY